MISHAHLMMDTDLHHNMKIESIVLLYGLTELVSLKDSITKGIESRCYQTSTLELLEEIPIFKSENKIMKYLKILSSENLIKMTLLENGLSYMITAKGFDYSAHPLIPVAIYKEFCNE